MQFALFVFVFVLVLICIQSFTIPKCSKTMPVGNCQKGVGQEQEGKKRTKTERTTKQQPKCWHAKCVINNFVCTFTRQRKRRMKRERERVSWQSWCNFNSSFMFSFLLFYIFCECLLAHFSGLRTSLSHSIAKIVVLNSTNIISTLTMFTHTKVKAKNISSVNHYEWKINKHTLLQSIHNIVL